MGFCKELSEVPKTHLAILAVALIECVALATGHNGAMMSLSVGAIGVFAGYSIKDLKDKI